jgi:hypothetical protein
MPGQKMPPQLRGTGLPSRAVAQKEHGTARISGPEAQAPAGGEIQKLGMAAHIAHDRSDGTAGNGFFGDPEQFGHAGGPDQNQGLRVEPKAQKPRSIRQAELLRLIGQLHVNDGNPLQGQKIARLGQGKAQTCPCIAAPIGEHFLQQSTRQKGKLSALSLHPLAGLRQSRFALDIGNSIPQRGKALLAIRGLHETTAM